MAGTLVIPTTTRSSDDAWVLPSHFRCSKGGVRFRRPLFLHLQVGGGWAQEETFVSALSSAGFCASGRGHFVAGSRGLK